MKISDIKVRLRALTLGSWSLLLIMASIFASLSLVESAAYAKPNCDGENPPPICDREKPSPAPGNDRIPPDRQLPEETPPPDFGPLSPPSWKQMPGCAKKIAAGVGGPRVIGCAEGGPGGYEIFSWNGSDWNKVDGAAIDIAIQPSGIAWVVSNGGKIFHVDPDATTSPGERLILHRA